MISSRHVLLVGGRRPGRDRAGQAALAGGAEGGAADSAGHQLGVGVGHHDHRVLGAAERLHPLAVLGGGRGRRARRRCRAHEGDRVDAGVLEQGVDRVVAAVDEADDAGRDLLDALRELDDALARERVLLEGFRMKVLPVAIAYGRNQSGIIAGKLKGVMRRDHADGLADEVDVDARGHARQALALQHLGRPHAASTDSMPRPTSPRASAKGLAHVERDQLGDFLTVVVEHLPEGEDGAHAR